MITLLVPCLHFPIEDPILKFLLILLIILLAPILLNRFKIPHLLGMIIAGAIVGPFGFHLMERDSSIIMSGTAGLLYIMFLAGLEIDLADFKKNSKKSIVFGLFTFVIPMTLGIFASLYLLNFSLHTSILLASMFASHTLIAYPIISKLGVSKNRAVNITVGGTMITDTLALLVLAIIVGMQKGDVSNEFWINLSISIVLFVSTITIIFPLIGRWFFKRFSEDNVAQYIFVLSMVFLGAYIAQVAGIEGIIGAFLTGLSLNKLIPQTSPLMNRIEFVGNAIFIPFFLISVGMLLDYKVFFKDFETIYIATIMTVVATVAKFLAAWITQKSFKFTVDERRLIFGLSNAQAAATLAAVLVGYNLVLNQKEIDAALIMGLKIEPIRLLSESVLNGTIVMILITCTIASFVAQKGAKNIALADGSNQEEKNDVEAEERILIPINRVEAADNLIDLSLTIKSKKNKSALFGLNIIDNNINVNNESADKKAKKILERAATTAASTDHYLKQLLRYDINIVNGIMSVVKEHKITDLILGLHQQKGFSESFLGNLTEGILTKCNTTTLIYKSIQPLSTIKRHLIVVPDKAEKEIGFPFWLIKVWNIARNTGAKLVFYATPQTINYIRDIQAKHPIDCTFVEFQDWTEFLIISRDVRVDDNLIIVLSRKDKPSFNNTMTRIPNYLNKHFQQNSFILIYPIQIGIADNENKDLMNASILEPIEKLDEIGKTIAKLFKRR